jgi:hypothetical protein
MLEGAGPDTILKATSPFFGQQFITSSNGEMLQEHSSPLLQSCFSIFQFKSNDSSGILRFDNVDHLEINNISMDIGYKLL